ncbi:MAG: discoidin domain-containing protein [Prevotella sp.]|nr:discoidin domain-containing protein [Prevotella sp.]
MIKKVTTIAISCLVSMNVMAQEKKAYMVADAHLDTQWNWDVQATIRDHIRNTLNQNLALFRQYSNYVFNFEGAVKYAWMKEYYPLEYQELKKYIVQGRWHIAGSSWDANETIISSPESMLRNFMLGQNFYRKEFGTEGTDVFLPDCFGFPYTLPTLAAHCGLIGFSSQKLMWRTKPFYEGNKRYPFTIGLWQGIDGSRIMMVHGFDYGHIYNDENISHSNDLMREINESSLGMAYRYYGTGDIGGSPTISSVRSIEKGLKGEGSIKIISSTSDQIYKDFLPYEKHPELPVFDGELPMDVHGNACYTSQAAMKLYNRQNENLGGAAERAAVMADWLGKTKYPVSQMTETWQRVIWHQFHDDVTGTSIPRAYEFSWNDELLALKKFSDVMTHSVGDIVQLMDTRVDGKPVVVYNSEAFPVNSLAEVELADDNNYQVVDANGQKVTSQVVQRNGKHFLLFNASVPSMGFAVYGVKTTGKWKNISKQGQTIENSRYKLSVDEYGDITSLFDKKANREMVVSGKSLRLVVFDDCLSKIWPAWEIQKATLDKAPVPVHDGVEISMESGPLRQTLIIKKKYGESEITQRIHLYEGGKAERIDFENEVDWRSLNALLKAEFPLNISNPEATYDIGLGNVKRGNNCDNLFEVYAHQWTDLTDRSGQYGITILNDSRYGWDKPNDNTMRLSLLYSPKVERNYAYQAEQDFGHHVFTYSLIGHQDKLYPSVAVRQGLELNNPLKVFNATKHTGSLGKSFSFVASDNNDVMVRALKRADESDEYVVRVYETSGSTEQLAKITFAAEIAEAVEADGTEKTIGQASFLGRSLNISIKPYSVKTYKVRLKKAIQSNTQFATSNIKLNFDRMCATFNEFRTAANFSDGYSFAAELWPSSGLIVDGINFCFGEKEGKNGLSCKGDTLLLPANQTYTHLYLLAASDKDDREGTFTVGKSLQTVSIPYYSGFIGQWGHDGQTRGFIKDAEVAWVGSHRHSPSADEPYEFTYMYKVKLYIPKGARQVILPRDRHIVLFAATLANDTEYATPAAPFFKTAIIGESTVQGEAEEEKVSLLKNAKIMAVSGEINKDEQAANLIDGRSDTKWCDAQSAPNYVVFDLGEPITVSRWRLLNGGCEMAAYITRTCLFQGRNSDTEEWQTLDMIDNNRNDLVDRRFPSATVRYVRLFVVSPTQGQMPAARIYELELF